MVGSLIAPVLVSALGATGALLVCGTAVVGYGLVMFRGARSAVAAVPAPALADDLAEGLLVAAEA